MLVVINCLRLDLLLWVWPVGLLAVCLMEHETECLHLEDVTTSDLACVHELVHLRELLEVDRLEGSMDQATSEERKSLLRILSIADI